MEAVNDNLLCLTAKMLVDTKGTDTFDTTEIMLYNMLARRMTKRNIDLLNSMRKPG